MPVRVVALVLSLCLAAAADPPRVTVTPDRESGIYEVGEDVNWTVTAGGGVTAIDYKLQRGGLTEVSADEIALTEAAAKVQATFHAPGTLLVEVAAKGADGTVVKAYGGAIASPKKIGLSAERPADFDAFWDAKVAEVAALPLEAEETLADSGRDGVAYAKVTLNHVRGARIHGQVARPAAGEKLPAMLIVQWAGVYGLDKTWTTGPAAAGWLVLNISAHDLPIDESPEFYKAQGEGPLKNYWALGNDDRETSYYLRMYLACYRAAEYLTQRPDWDGRTLIVTGGSQGGQQALVTAALHPKVTAALANVPAGCDMLGHDVGRKPGWPQWALWFVGNKDPQRVREAARYYDVANFAPRVRCPVLIAAGLLDDVCPPEGIVAAANQLAGPTELILMPDARHQEENGSHRPFHNRMWQAWLPALQRGETPPVVAE